MFSQNLCKYIMAFGLCFVLSGTPAQATDQPVNILPAEHLDEDTALMLDSTSETHPPLKLTPDKSELIRLDEPAGSIIIGNPAHLNILADSSQTLIIVPRAPGASHFAVLNKQGNVIMQRHAIVGSPKQKYVRVRRTCYGDYNVDDGCRPTRTYYCPDMCHEVSVNYESEGGETPLLGGAGSSHSDAEDDEDKKDEEAKTEKE